ncbi:MAG: hypothetical protein DRN27_09165 [Thermoplasmata archaeon]|nr:MAG: hypothetical protein DRN27_09165 [Thermoplasmata archaeon]
MNKILKISITTVGIIILLFGISSIATADSVQKTIFELEIQSNLQENCPYDIIFPEDGVIGFNPKMGTESYFNLSISEGGGDIIDGYYPAWCVEQGVLMSRNLHHQGDIYSSYDFENMPDYFTFNKNRNSTEHQMTWKKINFLLNNIENITDEINVYCPINSDELRIDIQDVIWNITNAKPMEQLSSCAQNITKYLENTSNYEKISGFCPKNEGDIIVILIDTYEEPEVEEETPNNNGGSSGGYSGNTPPTADGSKGVPYHGVVDENIQFDGSKSYDYNGEIIEWNWSFGDGTYDLGEIINHKYSNSGIFTVILTVTDNKGSTDTYETTAEIFQPNRPPSKPEITGESNCDLSVSYIYTARSIDPDNDTIKYTVDWGNGDESSTTELINNNTAATFNHIWNEPGIYLLKIIAEDEFNVPSDTAQLLIYVDIQVIYINDIINGYLIDYGKDGIFEEFHNNDTGKDIELGKNSDDLILIDNDNDGIWDWIYQKDSTLTAYANDEPEGQESESPNWLIIIIVIVAIGIIIVGFFIFKKR